MLRAIVCRLFHWMCGGWQYEGGCGGVFTHMRARCRRCGRCYAREVNDMLETDSGWRRLP